MFRCAALTLTFLFANALNVAAQQHVVSMGTTPLADAVSHAAIDREPTVTLWSLSQQPKRPGMLPLLYGAYASLQVMDVVSTRKALSAGAHEANPLMTRGGTAGTFAIKAASAVGVVYLSEKTWKKNRVGAIALMAVVNGISAAVVARNSHNASLR